MSERDGYEAAVPCWVAAVEPDGGGAASFYGKLFEWETENLMPADAPGDDFLCRLRGRDVAAIVSPHGAPPPPRPAWSHTCRWRARTDTFDTGGGEITVWLVPGYVGGEPQQPVSRDVVGAMLSGGAAFTVSQLMIASLGA